MMKRFEEKRNKNETTPKHNLERKLTGIEQNLS